MDKVFIFLNVNLISIFFLHYNDTETGLVSIMPVMWYIKLFCNFKKIHLLNYYVLFVPENTFFLNSREGFIATLNQERDAYFKK